MNNLFKVAALGLCLTAGLSSCESKPDSNTVQTPATGTTPGNDTTGNATTPGANAKYPQVGEPSDAAAGATAPATGSSTGTEEKK